MPYVVPILANASTGLESVGTVFSQLMDWIGNLVTTIVSTPLLLIPVGVFLAGAVIGLAYRLIRG